MYKPVRALTVFTSKNRLLIGPVVLRSHSISESGMRWSRRKGRDSWIAAARQCKAREEMKLETVRRNYFRLPLRLCVKFNLAKAQRRKGKLKASSD
jgi:hypothetical protein